MRVPVAAVIALTGILAACSGEAPERTVFDDKTDAIGKAEDVNALIEDAAARQRKAIDAQSE